MVLCNMATAQAGLIEKLGADMSKVGIVGDNMEQVEACYREIVLRGLYTDRLKNE